MELCICFACWTLPNSIPSRSADSQLRRTTRTSCHIYTFLPPDDGLLASPIHVEVQWLNKLKINSASGWFHYTHISRCCTVNKTLKNIVSRSLYWPLSRLTVDFTGISIPQVQWSSYKRISSLNILKTEVADTSDNFKATWHHIRNLHTHDRKKHKSHNQNQSISTVKTSLFWIKTSHERRSATPAAGDAATSTSTQQLCHFAVFPQSLPFVTTTWAVCWSTSCSTILNTIGRHSDVGVLGQTQKYLGWISS
jgi:hypothetical protein